MTRMKQIMHKPVNIKYCINLWLVLVLLIPAINSVYASTRNATDKQAVIDISDPYKKQRTLFLKAESALKKHQYAKYRKYYAQLKGYPLQPYLRYQEYRNKLPHLSEAKVLQFFKQYKDTPYADWLRVSWLDNKAKKQQWQQYLNAYTAQKSIQRQCHYLNALIQTGNKEKAFTQVADLWLSGKSRPRSCDPVFKAYKQAGMMSDELVKQRIKLAMKKGRASLAKYLARSLNKADQKWLEEWIKIYHKPALVLKSKRLQQNHEFKQDILLHAVERMARRQPEAAIKLLSSLQQKNTFTEAQQAKMYRAIGMKLAYRHGKGAWKWLDKITDQYSDATVREWRVRSAIREGKWDAIASAINRLSEEEQKNLRWQYWLASAREHQGNTEQAEKDFYNMAGQRSYYSFLAADKMDMPYEFRNSPLKPTQKELQQIAKNPGLLRAREFYFLGRDLQVRREWYFTTRKRMDNKQRAIAAKVAQLWGWHNRAIITMAHTDQRDDIELRFPVLQKDRVIKFSRQQEIKPAYTMAVIRRESAFATDARSRVGALGLMQIMPATGKVIAQKLKVKFNSKNQLLNPETNVEFGTKYLNMMLQKFYKQPALASAAYNAGGHRVKAWLPDKKKMQADRWIETIPFKETREYVSSILAYTAIYEHRMGLPQTRLEQVMQNIPSKQSDK